MPAPDRFFATPETAAVVAAAPAVVLLVGGYDGSGNFGDIAQLDAALLLVDRLGPGVLALPVVEPTRVDEHRALLAASLRPAPHVLSCGRPGDERQLAVPGSTALRVAAIYLYGGGHLNSAWGPRKLEMLRAAESFLQASGIEPACRLASGLQVETAWLDGLPDADKDILRRFDLMGGRDRESVAALSALAGHGPVLDTADDAMGVLRRAAGGQSCAALPAAEEILRVNVHLADHGWVGDTAPTPSRCAELLAELSTRLGRPVQAVPVIAYEDGWTTDRPALTRFAALCREHGLAVEAPHVLRPAGLSSDAAVLRRGELTISNSYHVALTSLTLGIPTVVLNGNAYYEQKAIGLRESFDIPATWFVNGKSAAWTACATAVTRDLAAVEGRRAWDMRLAAGRARVLHQRDAAEREVLGTLTAALLAALIAQNAEDRAALQSSSARSVELMEDLARLREDVQDVLRRDVRDLTLDERAAVDLARVQAAQQREVAEAEIERRLQAEAAHQDALRRMAALEAELQGERAALRAAGTDAHDRGTYIALLESRLEVLHGSTSWRITAPLRRLVESLRRG